MPAVRGLLHKLNPWHKEDAPPPPITTRGASLLLVLYALSYFVPFYLSRTTRPSPTLSRDAPSVIRARIRSVTLSCLLCTAATYLVLSLAAGAAPAEALHLLGLWPPALADALRALLLTALLFAGPLFAYLVAERGWRDWARLAPLKELWDEWTTWRNIVVGPITEEILFRSASIPLMLVARAPARQTVFLTPVIFGLAHAHHFYEFRLAQPHVPAARALARSLAQLAYTTLFGAYATFLFLRTGSLAAVCAVHAFCNCMGLPQVWGRVEPEQHDGLGFGSPGSGPVPVPMGGDAGGVSAAAAAAAVQKGVGRRPSILWTVAYYVLLVTGAVLWWRNLWRLSESGNALLPI